MLDLYICTYLKLPIRPFTPCLDSKGQPRICLPKEFDAWQDYCFINDGTGRFHDEAAARGLIAPDGKGLSVAIADFDNDHYPDIYVANDTTANFLFRGQANGHFVEEGMLRGCATDYQGLMQASMGLAVADFDRNGFLDIYSTHYYNESNTLYRNLGPSGFQDVTARMRLHAPTLKSLAFGTAWVDLDHDGWDELFVVNGHVDNHPRNQFLKCGRNCFAMSMTVLKRSALPQATTFMCFEWAAVSQPLIWKATEIWTWLLCPKMIRSVWLRIETQGAIGCNSGASVCNPNVPGGCQSSTEIRRLTLSETVSGRNQLLIDPERILHFGLGDSAEPVTIEITWPSGQTQTLSDMAVDKRYEIIESLP